MTIFRATQRCNARTIVVSVRSNVATMLKRFVALKIVVIATGGGGGVRTNRLVQHRLYAGMTCMRLEYCLPVYLFDFANQLSPI